MVHLHAVVNASKTSISTGEADTRVNQLTEAKVEYMKTREYKQKPELPPKSMKRKPGEGTGALQGAKTCPRPLRNSAAEGA